MGHRFSTYLAGTAKIRTPPRRALRRIWDATESLSKVSRLSFVGLKQRAHRPILRYRSGPPSAVRRFAILSRGCRWMSHCREQDITRLWMHVLGEPLGRQLVAKAAVFGLAVDHRAGRRELVAEPDIVEKAGDL